MSYKLKGESLVTFDSATLSGGYDKISQFSNPIIKFRVNNESNTSVEISYDGISSQDYVLSNDSLDIDLNTLDRKSDMTFIPKGTSIYFKGVAGIGNIYITAYYLDN